MLPWVTSQVILLKFNQNCEADVHCLTLLLASNSAATALRLLLNLFRLWLRSGINHLNILDYWLRRWLLHNWYHLWGCLHSRLGKALLDYIHESHGQLELSPLFRSD